MPDTTDDLSLDEARKPVPVLRRSPAAGMEGHDVARLQSELRRAGLSPGSIDGILGDRTLAALAEFAARNSLATPVTAVDTALWTAILRAGALAQADAHEALARAREQAGAAAQDLATAAQKLAADQRTQSLPAGADESRAADHLLGAAQHWRAAADSWLASATILAPHADPDARASKAHARHLRALDLVRALATRTVNSLALAGKDLDAAGGTDHRERLAANTLAARALATV
ncbi:MAG: peptidoglycan-binding protein [Myxococcales bacterium]|nr:peptidoglycan-binding protein [Myxococcales bacterium]